MPEREQTSHCKVGALPPECPRVPPVVGLVQDDDGRRKSFFETLGVHFVVGSAISTLCAAIWICSGPARDYPATVALGGTPVVLVQLLLLWAGVSARQWAGGRRFEERHWLITSVVGLMGSALVFGLPPLAALWSPSETTAVVSTLIPLIGGPVVSAIAIARPMAQ